MEKQIVANASSIIFIGKLRIFDLVKNLFQKIILPKEVVKEIFMFDKPENLCIKEQINLGFIKKQEVNDIKNFPIDIGERAAISLCLEKDINFFLSDDKKARTYARFLKVNTIGVLGIILGNLKNNNINKKQTREIINTLIKKGYYMDSELYTKIIDLIK